MCPQGPLCPPEDSSHLGQQVPDAKGIAVCGALGRQEARLSPSSRAPQPRARFSTSESARPRQDRLGRGPTACAVSLSSRLRAAQALGPHSWGQALGLAPWSPRLRADHRDPHILCASPCLSLGLPHCPEHCWVSGGLTTSWTHTLTAVEVPPSTPYSAWSPGARRKQPRSCPSEGSRGGCPRAGPVWGRQDEKAQWTQWTQGQQHLLELEEVGPFHARSACLGHAGCGQRGRGPGDNLWPVWPQPPGRGQGQPPGVQVSERSGRSGCRGPGCARRAARDCRAWVGAPRPAAGPRGHRAQELPSEEALRGGQ